jgi:hypothetical protein
MVGQIAIFGAFAVLTVLSFRYGAANRAWFKRYMAPKMDSPEEASSFARMVIAAHVWRIGGIRTLFSPDPDPETERLRTIAVNRLRPQLLIMGAFVALFLILLPVVLVITLVHAIVA